MGLSCVDASFVLPQDPIRRLREIFSDKIRLHRPLCRVPGKFTFTITGVDENAAHTRVSREFDVPIAITDLKVASQIEPVLLSSTVKHADCGLAAVTVSG